MLLKVVLLSVGVLGAIAGNHPWDGPVLASLTATNGLHVGDLPAVLTGVALLARWTAVDEPLARPVTP